MPHLMPGSARYALVIVSAGVLVGCGSGYSRPEASRPAAILTATATAIAAAAPSPAAASGAVKLGDGGALGKILVDTTGLTLYTFGSDAPGSGKSSCNAGCATAWPPLVTSAISEKLDGAAATLSLITRDDGAKQVAYGGRPLYRFQGDRAPGEVNGNGVTGFGGLWSASRSGGASSGSAATPASGAANDLGY